MVLKFRPYNTTFFVYFYQAFWHTINTKFLNLNSLETVVAGLILLNLLQGHITVTDRSFGGGQ